ncbi:COX15/CtaA family protein [Nocardioides insulae]|uniref:COX15/CtaA family protein n=1 Tax=Nocardioides insulae TaxID=394734 RepID=UPI0012F8CADB
MTQTAPLPSRTTRLGRWLWWTAVANLVANIGIIVTGGVVRLTGSGLGCPTWPQCSEGSYVAHGALGWHGVIEFGNRLLTFVLAAIAIGCWVLALLVVRAQRRSGGSVDRRPLVLTTIIALGIPMQAVIGGITVLTDLNPYVVALHLLCSMAMVGVCVLLLDVLRGPERPAAGSSLRVTGLLTFVVGWVVLWLGTVVTGSGPHSGDLDSHRTGLDPEVVSRVHALSVYALVALTVVAIVLARRMRLRLVTSAALLLLGVELLQGVIGYVQYFTGLPAVLVGLHMLGAALTSAAITWLLLTTRARSRG